MALSLSTTKYLNPVSPKLSNYQISDLLCIKYCKRIFGISIFYNIVKFYISRNWINRINSHIIVFNIFIFFIFKNLSISKFVIPPDIIYKCQLAVLIVFFKAKWAASELYILFNVLVLLFFLNYDILLARIQDLF